MSEQIDQETSLNRATLADWARDSKSADRRRIHSRRQENIFSVGFGLFVLGNWFYTYQALVDPTFVNIKADPRSFTAILYALTQTSGLTIMTLADVDANAFLARNRARCKGFLLAWGLAYLASVVLIPVIPGGAEYDTLGFSLAVLPFVYVLARYEQVVSASEEYPRLTEIFTVVLSLDLLAHFILVVIQYLVLRRKPITEVPWPAVVFYFPIGSIAVVASYQWSRRLQHQSHTVSFKTATCIYLLAFGAGVLVICLWNAFHDHITQSIGGWLMGPVHIIPGFFVLGFRAHLTRWLGLCWLSRRGEDWEAGTAASEMVNLEQRRGNLVEVEEAISAQDDLNRFVHTSESDDFTLLQLAVLNGHLDAVQRLLQTGTVMIDKPTRRLGKTALLLAAELGSVNAATMLIELNADVNALSDEGQSPLIIAAAQRHTGMMKLLREHGASEEYKWMGLTAEDVLGSMESAEVRRSLADTKGTQKRRLTGKGGQGQGQPGYDNASASGSMLFGATTSTATGHETSAKGSDNAHRFDRSGASSRDFEQSGGSRDSFSSFEDSLS